MVKNRIFLSFDNCESYEIEYKGLKPNGPEISDLLWLNPLICRRVGIASPVKVTKLFSKP